MQFKMGYVLGVIAFTSIFIIIQKLWCFWNKSKVCLVGKTAVITGGASGIGYETALGLAAYGCRIIIATRDIVKASTAAEKIILETHNPNVIVKELELQSFKSVREFAKDLVLSGEKLDILICNAGIGDLTEKLTEDGLQITMQTNYFSHFLLIHLLLDLLKKSSPSRIIFNSSTMSYLSGLTTDRLNPKSDYLDKWTTRIRGGCYANSKLAMVAAAKVFGEKLKGTEVTINTVHPGGTRTPIYSKILRNDKSPLVWTFRAIVHLLGKSSEEGAQTLIYLAQSKEVENITGIFFAEGIRIPLPFQLSDEFCQDIWNKSIEYTKLETWEVKC